MKKSEQRKKEDCELLDDLVNYYVASKQLIGICTEQFKKDNDLLPNNVTGWYLNREEPLVLLYKNLEKGVQYGISDKGNWLKGTAKEVPLTLYPATPEEVLERLSKYAIEKGYKDGVKIKSLINGGGYGVAAGMFGDNFYSFGDGKLWCGGSCIMKDGVWAEFVEDENPQIAKLQNKLDKIQK